jgi:hypothetical protein
VILELTVLAFLGGALALDRGAGIGLMLSQPLAASCLAGSLLNPGPSLELWALRVPLGVGALLQLTLTDASLPAAQRPYETATAGAIGAAVAHFSMAGLQGDIAVPTGGLLWVVVGTLAGLVAAYAGGIVTALVRRHNRGDLPRADALAAAGRSGALENLYWWGVSRVLLHGAAWTLVATAALTGVALVVLPRIAPRLSGDLIGFSFAGLLGAGLAASFLAHVRGRPGGLRWAVLGALIALLVRVGRPGGGPL